MISVFALAIACLIPLLFLIIVYQLDLYKTGNYGNIAMALGGGIMAYWAAFLINPWMRNHGLVSGDVMVRFSAPVLEEILKGLILLFLVRRASFTYFVDGAIYGFAAGIGFAIFENVEYINGNPGAALSLAIARVLSTNLIHATGSGLIGIALGWARFDRSTVRRIAVLVLGAGLAMAIHIGFNNIVNSHIDLILVYAIGSGFAGAILIGSLMRVGLREEKTWIMEKLGDEDRVTSQEKNAVEGLDKLHKTLSPLAVRFGTKKAAEVEKFLTVQAQLGIYRKALEKHSDEKMRQDMQAKIDRLSAEMDEARRQVGIYCMLYLRNTFLDETAGLLYNRLNSLLEERAAAAGAQSGGGQAWMKAFGAKLEPQPPENE